jgi:transposase
MPPVDRNNPVRAKSSQSRCSFMEFQREFPDDATCLEWLWRNRFSPDGEHAYCPKCEQERTFKRYEKIAPRRQSWTCTGCGHHIHPTAGTIFHKSSTSLQLWFYAIFLMSSTKCGIAAKQLEREIGVNYKTALRMLRQIRTELMVQDDMPLSGKVEADETFMGGKLRESDRRKLRAQGTPNRGPASKSRAVVMGVVERQGKISATVIPSRGKAREVVESFVLPGSMIFTDDWGGYVPLSSNPRYQHRRINHSQRVYVSGDVHTQTIEGFFGHFKTDVRGTHHSISTRYLPTYLNEWVWKWNHRHDDEAMYRQLLASAASV